MFKRLLPAFFSFALLGTASGISSAGVTVPDVLKYRIALKKTAQQLNVVYFLGSDTEPVPDYERRLSELLLYLQQFYGREMQRHGYGARSFGLDIKSPGRVNIIEYKAKNPAAHYPYANGGGWKAAQELEEFFKANPDRKKSQHTLVIMPTWNDEKNGPDNPGGVPFYGMGRNCFALDYPAFDIKHLGQKTREGQLLTKWYGGLAHELGHGLNLPHNHQTASDGKKYGTALMGAGNYTFGTSPTFLTPARAAWQSWEIDFRWHKTGCGNIPEWRSAGCSSQSAPRRHSRDAPERSARPQLPESPPVRHSAAASAVSSQYYAAVSSAAPPRVCVHIS